MELIVAIIIIGGIALWLYFRIQESRKIKQVVANLSDFKSNELIESCVVGKTAIAIDKNSRKICFIYDTGGKGKRTSVFGYRDIFECELVTDDETYLKSSATRTIAGYVVGGAVGGVAGAIVGGLSGSKTQKTKIKSIKLNIRVNDNHRPMFHVLFLNKEVEKSSSDFKIAMKNAEHWHGMISNFISLANKEEATGQTQNPVSSTTISISNEILKLKELMDNGLITKEQFEAQKLKLLS